MEVVIIHRPIPTPFVEIYLLIRTWNTLLHRHGLIWTKIVVILSRNIAVILRGAPRQNTQNWVVVIFRGCTLNRRHSWPSLFDYHTLSSEYAINRRNRSEWVKLRRHDYFSDLSNDEVLLRVGPTLTNNRPTVPQQHCFGHLFQPRTRRRQRLRLDHSPTTDTSI